MAYRKPYAMRHSYASWCLAAGMNTFAVAERMGTSVQMIDDTYGHLISDSIERETALLDDFDKSALPFLAYKTKTRSPMNTPIPRPYGKPTSGFEPLTPSLQEKRGGDYAPSPPM